MSSIIKFNNVDFFFTPNFNYKNKIKIFSNLNFEINQNEKIGVIGLNGSGKSTLLKLISGIYRPSSGEVYLKYNCTGYFNLNHYFHLELTGFENLKLALRLCNFTGEKLLSKLKEIIETSGLNERINQKLKSYSDGMKLRLGFSFTIAISEKILLLDEWIGSGDIQFRKIIQHKLSRAISSSYTSIIASNDPRLIINTCDKVIYLKNNEIFFFGDPEQAISEFKRNN